MDTVPQYTLRIPNPCKDPSFLWVPFSHSCLFCASLSTGVWWCSQWVHNWRQWLPLSQNPSVANNSAWRIGSGEPIPDSWLLIDRSGLVQAKCRQLQLLWNDDWLAMSCSEENALWLIFLYFSFYILYNSDSTIFLEPLRRWYKMSCVWINTQSSLILSSIGSHTSLYS